MRYFDYELGQKLGEGNFGKVYRAGKKDDLMHGDSDGIVMKMLKENPTHGNLKTLEQLEDEGKREIANIAEADRLGLNFVVGLPDFNYGDNPDALVKRLKMLVDGVEEEHVVLGMNYVPGKTVRDFLSEVGNDEDGTEHEKLIEHFKFLVIAAIVDFVHQMQAVGMVHGDVHAGNVMIDRFGKLTLVDLGMTTFQKDIRSPSSNKQWKKWWQWNGKKSQYFINNCNNENELGAKRKSFKTNNIDLPYDFTKIYGELFSRDENDRGWLKEEKQQVNLTTNINKKIMLEGLKTHLGKGVKWEDLKYNQSAIRECLDKLWSTDRLLRRY